MNLRTLRTQASLTQAELARRMGTSRAHIDRIEKGDVTPSVRTCRKLATSIGVSVSDILSTIPEAE